MFVVLAAQGPKGDTGPQGPPGPEATTPARTAHLIVIRHVDNSGFAGSGDSPLPMHLISHYTAKVNSIC
jgi:hypothetical protein